MPESGLQTPGVPTRESADSTAPFNQHLIKRDASLIGRLPEGPGFLLISTLSLIGFVAE